MCKYQVVPEENVLELLAETVRFYDLKPGQKITDANHRVWEVHHWIVDNWFVDIVDIGRTLLHHMVVIFQPDSGDIGDIMALVDISGEISELRGDMVISINNVFPDIVP